MPLKVDLHCHIKGDPVDTYIKHSGKQLIEYAREKGYDALAITNHTHAAYTKELADIAEDNGIILIPGMETNVVDRRGFFPAQRKHVLLYGQSEPAAVRALNDYSERRNGDLSFDDIRRLKKDGLVLAVAAPHSYHVGYSLNGSFAEHHDLFDLVELSWFHTAVKLPESLAAWNFLNRNQIVQAVNGEFGLPYFASSDAHRLQDFGRAFSWIHADKNLDSIMEALQSRDPKRIELDLEPMLVSEYLAAIPRLLLPKQYQMLFG